MRTRSKRLEEENDVKIKSGKNYWSTKTCYCYSTTNHLQTYKINKREPRLCTRPTFVFANVDPFLHHVLLLRANQLVEHIHLRARNDSFAKRNDWFRSIDLYLRESSAKKSLRQQTTVQWRLTSCTRNFFPRHHRYCRSAETSLFAKVYRHRIEINKQ